ncbi:hypothetical protein DRW41_05690 [Neobacillus piezotolerans]|uniref:DUF3592 domain-containing protein n=1 Tax=Neobacillus piezotolerans TaxID=2259171 RepID=A0A3D8GSZ8_9BACI|nr:hypothetical protein [Neobacillus piezotolerans]RDU37339.1 hypothetical protein DRW41_05690 [Neobacillus piezotolerans]
MNMGWLVIVIPIIGGIIGITLQRKKGKNNARKAHQKLAFEVFKNHFHYVCKKNLFYDGDHLFVIKDKGIRSYGNSKIFYYTLKTESGEFEHRVFTNVYDYNKLKKGQLVNRGLIRHKKKNSIYTSSENKGEKAISRIQQRSVMVILSTIVVMGFALSTLVYMVMKFLRG